ncbi:MAG: hypothetical protein KQJ78_22470 [Deltaproteobacteria bacterium]|nr:hypothetical protein [Deltaproteobacteria bacterium]
MVKPTKRVDIMSKMAVKHDYGRQWPMRVKDGPHETMAIQKLPKNEIIGRYNCCLPENAAQWPHEPIRMVHREVS